MDLSKLKHLDKLIYLYHVVNEGGFAKAATRIGVTSSAVSKNILELENTYQVKLLIRRKKKEGIELTAEGKKLYLFAVQMLHEAERIVEEISHEKTSLRDYVKIITTTGLVSLWILPKLIEFIKKYPDLQIRIYTTNDNVVFSETDADVAILPKVADPSKVLKRKLCTFHSCLYASEEYIKEHGMPDKKEDLLHHRLISFYHDLVGHRGGIDWHLKLDSKKYIEPKLVINSAIGQFVACSLGMGVVTIAREFPLLKGSNLVECLPNEPGTDVDVFYITKSSSIKNEMIEDLYHFLLD
jgi:DNA-binding transcriptional LysR family regulator